MPNEQAASIRPFIPILARIYGPVAPMGYALVRIFTAAVLVPHGIQKLFFGGAASSVAGKAFVAWGLPAPLALTYGIGVLELVGGVMLVLGLFTRPVALLFAIELLVFIFGVHIDKGWLWNRGGYQYPTFLFGLMLAFVLRGGGHYSLDRLIGKEI
jgi:putative oxidoreductase